MIAGLLFLMDGQIISEFAKTDQVLAEFIGIGLAVVFVILGFVAKTAVDDLNGEDSAAQ